MKFLRYLKACKDANKSIEYKTTRSKSRVWSRPTAVSEYTEIFGYRERRMIDCPEKCCLETKGREQTWKR